MQLSHRFSVPIPVEGAWAAFNDLEQIAPCFPGATLTSFDGSHFAGVCKVKLGPIALQYTGTGQFVERDEAAKKAVIEATGKDRRGNGTAAVVVTARLADGGEGTTEVLVVTDLNITGRPAQFGRGVLQDVSDKLLAQFAARLEADLGGSSQSPALADDAPARHLSPVSDPSQGPGDIGTRSHEEAPPVELDLGATLLPVLVRRYAPYLVAGAVVLFLLRKFLRRP